MAVTAGRLFSIARSITWIVVLVVATLLPHRWCWPLSALAATLLIWPSPHSLRALLTRHGTLIIGSFLLLVARTGWDFGWWLPWTGVLILLAFMRNRWPRRRLTAIAFMPVLWAVTAALLVRSLPPSVTSEPVAANAILVCAGDSLTAGVDIKSDADTYVAHLRQQLGCTVINAGRASDRAADLLARLDKEVLSKHPDMVLLFIGGNDYMDGTPRDAFKHDFDAIVDRIAAACPRVLIVEVPTGIVWNPYAGIYRQAAARHHATLVPESNLRWWFTIELLLRDQLATPMTIDGIHFSPAGANKVADWLEPYVRMAWEISPATPIHQ